MREIKVYRAQNGEVPMYPFLLSLDRNLYRKALSQIAMLANISAADMKEPHIKHFVIEKYNQLYELRVKKRILVRIIFVISDEDVLLLEPFIKRQKRDTVTALEKSIRMLSAFRENPECAIKFLPPEEEEIMK